MHELLCIVNKQGIVQYTTTFLKELFGYGSEIVGTNVLEIFCPEEWPEMELAFSNEIQTNKKNAVGVQVNHKNSKTTLIILPLFSQDGDDELIAIYRCIYNFNVHDDFYNHIELYIFLSKPTKDGHIGKIIDVNQFGCKMLGYKQNELRQMSFDNIIYPIGQVFKLNGESNPFLTIRTVFLTKSGEKLPVILNSHATNLEGEEIILTIARDLINDSLYDDQQDYIDSGKRLRMLMAEMDINTSELAKMTNLSIATISNLRTGKVKNPNIETAEKIAHTLGVKISYIWPHLRY